jgi:hypothetical protein
VKRKKAKERLLTENEFFNATGLDEDARQKYEAESWLRPTVGSDGRKSYSHEDVELGKELGTALKKYTEAGLPRNDAYDLVAEGIASKLRRTSGPEADEKGYIDPDDVEMHPTFSGLLGIKEDLLNRITADMAANGYDQSKPIILATWPGQDTRVIIDGHTRTRAWASLGKKSIPYIYRKFDSLLAALQHAAGLQTRRRITTDAVLFRLIKTYDSLCEKGGDRRSDQAKSMPTPVGSPTGRSASAHKTAIMVGCNYKKVEKVRRIIREGSTKLHKQISDGPLTINKAYNALAKKAKEEKKLESAPPKTKTTKIHLTEENLAALKKLGGDLHAHVNRAVKGYLNYLRRDDASAKKKQPPAGEDGNNS